MLFKIFCLICLFLIKSTTCSLPTNVQDLELDDVTSLWDKFPSLIDKIKETVSRLRCPKGWKRLGGSCYYFSNVTALVSHVNYTCNYLHSNLSNLILIRSPIELFYAAHVLARNNLSSLVIEIDSSLLKGKKISELLKTDDGRWKRMKEKFQEIRIKYQKLKAKIVDRLTSAGLRILRRTKKMKPIPANIESLHDENDFYQNYQYEYSDKEFYITNLTHSNNSHSIINTDEYEYDDLDSLDEIDEFEQLDNTHGICDDIHWNVLNDTNHTTLFILTKYNMSDKIICSLSDVEVHTRYHHICEYVLDYCFANIICGKRGHCVNTLTGFKCACNFLYGGLLCEKFSDHGIQIITSIVLILIMVLLSIKAIRSLLWFCLKLLIKFCKKNLKLRKQKQTDGTSDTQHLLSADKVTIDGKATGTLPPQQRRQTLAEEIMEIIRDILRCICMKTSSNPLLSPVKRNLFRNIWVGALSVLFLTLLFVITTIMYYVSFGQNSTNDDEEQFSINDTIRLVTDCAALSDYRRGNLIFAPFACALIFIFSWSIKRESLCIDMCDSRPGLIPPIEPFRTGNRFTTATVFGILAYEVLKIFEELLFDAGQPLNHGVLIELLQRIALVIVVGLRYYPVLASLQLRNIVARFFACLYIICNIIYTIVREGSCMAFLPLSGQYTALEEAKLRRELGTWFIVYGLLKNLPHFFFLSYIGAELCVRFIYDSIYVPWKKNKSIWSAPIVQADESEFAKYYVTKLFRRNWSQTRHFPQQKLNIDNVIDYEHEMELQNQANKSRFKRFINFFYHFDDDFRFTTLAMCTYTVAFVFLYYLACTFVFLYLSRTTGHVAFLKFYFETTFNIDLGAYSFNKEIIISAVLTGLLYASQLFLGMQNYKKHKLQLYKGIYIDIPSSINFKPSTIASNSVHYSGFLVGYMAWGFVICFHFVLLILIGIRILSLQIRHVEIALSIIVPILVIYLLKMLSMTSAGKFIFIQKLDDKLNLKSRKTYAVFVYFSFFADCFLGIASCIIRLIKATFLNIVFMARLDWSFLGRPLEKFDLGFAAYVSYLHMEATYTNPIMLAFCYSLYDDIVERRPKEDHPDECCFVASEVDEEGSTDVSKETNVQKNVLKVEYRRTSGNHELSISKPTSRTEPKASLEKLSTEEIPSQNLSTISTKSKSKNTNSKLKQSSSSSSSSFPIVPEIPHRDDVSSEQNESEDERLKLNTLSTVEKLVPKPRSHRKSPTQLSKIDTDEDNDKEIAKSNVKIRKNNGKRSIKTRNQDDSNISKRNESIQQKNSTDETIQMLIPTKRSKAASQQAEHELSSTNTDDDMTQSFHEEKSVSTTTTEIPGRKALKKADGTRSIKLSKTTDNDQYTTIAIEDEPTNQMTTFNSSLSNNLPTDRSGTYPLRTISYHKAQQTTPPLTLHRSHISSLTHHPEKTHDDNSHYTEIPTNTSQTTVSNRSYSKTALIGNSYSHSTKKPVSKVQEQDDDINMQTEEEDEKEQSVKSQPTVLPSANNQDEAERIRRRKRLRFRWHFLYTILRNYHLFDLIKDVQNRLTRLRLQRSNLMDEQQFMTSSPMEISTTARSTIVSTKIESQELERSVSDIPRQINQRPPVLRRLVSVPVSICSEYPPSPAERYVAIRAQMLYDSNIEQPNSPHPLPTTPTPITTSSTTQQMHYPMTVTFSGESLGFPTAPDVTVHPPPARSLKSGSSALHVLQSENIPATSFKAIPVSDQSTTAYPLAGSSVINSSTYRTQMSHEQHMQAWRQDQIEKIQRKQRHCYIYGVPPQPSPVDRVSTAAILTPQIISTITPKQNAPSSTHAGNIRREPTPSPFLFPVPSNRLSSTSSSAISDSQTQSKNQKSKTDPPQPRMPVPPPRMDRLDEDPQEISNADKSSKVTSVLIHRKDSQTSSTKDNEDV